MRKTLLLLLALAMCITTCGCAAKVEKVQKNPDGTVTVVEPDKSAAREKIYSKMTLDEKLKYMSEQEPGHSEATGTSMAPVLDPETQRWGYITPDGNYAIEPAYKYAGVFADGIAPVLDGYSEFSFIKEDGEKYVSTVNKKSVLASSHASEGILPITIDIGQDQNKVYLDSELKTTDATDLPKTSGIKYQNTKYYMTATAYKNGKAIVMRRTNESVLLDHDRASMEKKKLYQSAYVIDTAGKIVTTLPAGYDADDYCLDSNGIVILRNMTDENGFYGLFDLDGKQITDCKYRRIEHCDGNTYLVCGESGFWGYITKDGKELTGCIYVEAHCFSDGLAAVCTDKGWGVIDDCGLDVIPYEWEDFGVLTTANPDTNIGSAAFSQGVAAAKKGPYWALIDAEGNIKYAVKAEECPFKAAGEGLIAFEKDGLWGYMNPNGEICIEPQFAQAGAFCR